MDINNRITATKESCTLAISSRAKELKAEGKDVLSFATGEPDFDTPQRIKDALIRSLNAGQTKYTQTAGIPQLREAICEKLNRDNGLDYASNEVIVTCGAKHAIYNALRVILQPDEEVLVPAPYWVSYPDQVVLAGGVCKVVDCSKEDEFKLTPEKLTHAINHKTRALILNSPSNPTGMCYTREELAALADVCLKHKIFIISDEIYEKLIYDGFQHVSIAALAPEIRDITITINGLSKSHAMTGWRVGYAAAPRKIIKLMDKLQGQQITHIPTFIQYASIEALSGPEDDVKKMCSIFKERRDLALQRIRKIDGLECLTPQGAFYIFPSVKKILGGKIKSSLELAERLLNEVYVATVPGEGFGSDGYIRLSYATSNENILKGLDRIEEGIQQILKS